MRAIFGIGVRSELIRVLWGSNSAALSIRELSEAIAYSKRNVQETIRDLTSAQVVQEVDGARLPRYRLLPEQWHELLTVRAKDNSEYVPWPAYLAMFRSLLRWLWEVSELDQSDYMRASEAHRFLEGLPPLPQGPGEVRPSGRASDPFFWDDFVAYFTQLLSVLR